jgi:hypothetical protein
MFQVRGEEFDYFHDLIVTQEMVRANARGFQDGSKAEIPSQNILPRVLTLQACPWRQELRSFCFFFQFPFELWNTDFEII